MRTDALAVAAAVATVVACGHPKTTQAPAPERSGPAATTTTPAAGSGTAAATTGPRGIGLGGISSPNADPFPSTYHPFRSRPTVIRNATLLTAAGPAIRNGAPTRPA